MKKWLWIVFGLVIGGVSLAQSTVTQEALTLDFGDFQSKAELSYPSEGGPFATVILIPGSGPEDMNATIFGFTATGPVKLSAIFGDIAKALNDAGFAVLRYNKHYVTGPGQFEAQQFYSNLTLEQMLSDATKVLETALAHPQVDPERVFLYGWSEGSTVAAALAVHHPELAGLIVQGPVAQPWRENFLYQIQAVGLPYLEGFVPDGKVSEATLKAVQQGGGGLVAKGILNYLGDPQAFQQGKLAVNPQLDKNKDGSLELATELTTTTFNSILDQGFATGGFFNMYAPENALPFLNEQVLGLDLPVLILQGANDANVPARGAEEFAAALEQAGNRDVTLHLYLELGHSLGPASSLIDDNFRPIDAAPLKDLANWLRQRSQ